MTLAIITAKRSDLSRILESLCETTILSVSEFTVTEKEFDAYAFLGGTEKDPIILPIDARLKAEAIQKSGKPMFFEYYKSLGDLFTSAPIDTVSGRMVYVGDDRADIAHGDLLDDRANSLSHPYFFAGYDVTPILVYGGHIVKHSHTDEIPKEAPLAIWKYDSNTLICGLRLCNFVSARFAPFGRWKAIVSLIAEHLIGSPCNLSFEPSTTLCGAQPNTSLAERIKSSFEAGMAWFDSANLYLDDGKSGVLEGLSHKIFPDGVQQIAPEIRNDCSGEVAGACFFDWFLHQNEHSLARFRNLYEFCFEKMQVKEGHHTGMMRWSTWEFAICYQDDVARVILGALLAMQLTGDRTHLPSIEAALDYLVSTTGCDGLRVSRTDNFNYSDEAALKVLSQTPGAFPCAHHNAYYLATLLLAYQQNGNQLYLDTACKGFDAMMAAYPDTIREHSETQELCRLVFPLAVRYETTKDPAHLADLERVVNDLERFRHPNGGFAEYDTGYKAERSRTAGDEASLLADNGDPVCDLLYSLNWLPLGFSYAYKVTRDEKYASLWKEISNFLSEVQFVSDEPTVHGAWCRGIDLELREPFGMPHDIGWGPCCIESGWTVAEILMGFGLGIYLGLTK